MNEFVFLTHVSWTDRVAWTLLHFLWQGALLGLTFAALRRVLFANASPRERYGLACLTLVLMAIAPIVTFWALGPESAPGVYRYIPRAAGAAAEPAGGWQLFQPGAYETVLPWIVAVWLAGACAFSLRLAGGWFVAARLRFAGEVRPAPADWQLALNRLAARMGVSRPVRFLTSTLAHTPMAIGHLRPIVLVPLGALAGLPADQLEALLAHELAHIWRRDYLMNLAQSVIESLLFYHPAVWYVSRQIRNERELCCDDIAVSLCGGRVAYARALAGIELLRFSQPRMAMAANGGQLLDRIRRLVEPDARPKTRPGFGGALALAVLLATAVAAAAMHETPLQRTAIRVNYRAQSPAELRGESEPPAVPAARPQEAAPAREDEPRDEPRRPEGVANRIAFAFNPNERQSRERAAAHSILSSIEIRGFSDEAGNDLLARLPVHEGDRLQPNSLELVGRVARQYGDHIEYRLDLNREDSAVLYIHPAGSANAPLLHRK